LSIRKQALEFPHFVFVLSDKPQFLAH
jgi:hypothetical protein